MTGWRSRRLLAMSPSDEIFPSLMLNFLFQFYDLLNIFKLNGLPSRDNPYLFKSV